MAIIRRATAESRICSIWHVLGGILIVWMLMLLVYLHQHHSPRIIPAIPSPASGDSRASSASASLSNRTTAPVRVETNRGDTGGTRPKEHVHIIFSTDCEFYQDWQTLVLFQSALIVGQHKFGPVTRIASGCSEAKKAELTALYKKLYPDPQIQFGVHFTPDFKNDAATNRKYAFYNKPWGLKHWLENASPPIPAGEVVVLLDPDMILLRPITSRIRGVQNNLHRRKYKPESLQEFVSLGQPVAQEYGLGAPWTDDHHKKFNRSKVCPPGSPCLSTARPFGEEHFSVGPPYLVVKEDMVRLAEVWTTFVPRVYSFYPYLLAEMYAYSMAAAHLNLPHLQMEQYMVSNIDAGGEGWPWVDKLTDSCVPPNVQGIFYPEQPIPTVLHFCQTFRLGQLQFHKGQHRDKFIDCNTASMPSIPEGSCKIDLAAISWEKERERHKTARHEKRGGFALNIVYHILNSTIAHYQRSDVCKTAF